jgi:hypothetical protein
MKKVFAFMAVAACMLFAGKANAQLTVNLGYAPTTLTTTYSGNDSKMDLNGFFVGANYNINLTGDLNVAVGADFRYNTKTESDGATVFGITASSEVTNTQMLIDVPVLFNYGLNLNSDIRVSAFVGPTFSLALSGKTTSEGSVAGFGGSSELEWYGDDSNMKKFDIGLTFGLELGYRQYRLFGGYNMGLMNLTDADDTTVKAAGWFVGLGFAL